MGTNFFFNSSWAGQLLVGVGLFGCSFFLEYRILSHFITPASLALCLAITLEGGKVAAIIWHYYLGYLQSDSYPPTVRLTSLVFRFGLVLLSLLCSLLFLTSHLDRPNLQKIRQERLDAVLADLQRKTAGIKKRYQAKDTRLVQRQQREMTVSNRLFADRIKQLENLLRREMDNVIGGEFRGKRYREIERRLALEKRTREAMAADLRRQQAKELDELERELDRALASARLSSVRQRREINGDDFATSDRANDARIVALLKTVNSIFHCKVLPLQFVFFFSILISLLMETGIMLSFATITMAIAPVLHARHLEELEKETIRVRSRGISEQDAILHQAAMDRARKAGNRALTAAAKAHNQAVNAM